MNASPEAHQDVILASLTPEQRVERDRWLLRSWERELELLEVMGAEAGLDLGADDE